MHCAIAYVLPGYSGTVGGAHDIMNFSFGNELWCNCRSQSTLS